MTGELDGLKILLVEDEAMVALLLEEMLQELGCGAVWRASSVTEALALLRDRRPDAAVLDINLAGEFAYPIASELEAAQIPFVYSTGYGSKGVPAQWATRPVIQKPFQLETLAAALRSALKI
jgi:CheY-like chemotaxis protein